MQLLKGKKGLGCNVPGMENILYYINQLILCCLATDYDASNSLITSVMITKNSLYLTFIDLNLSFYNNINL